MRMMSLVTLVCAGCLEHTSFQEAVTSIQITPGDVFLASDKTARVTLRVSAEVAQLASDLHATVTTTSGSLAPAAAIVLGCAAPNADAVSEDITTLSRAACTGPRQGQVVLSIPWDERADVTAEIGGRFGTSRVGPYPEDDVPDKPTLTLTPGVLTSDEEGDHVPVTLTLTLHPKEYQPSTPPVVTLTTSAGGYGDKVEATASVTLTETGAKANSMVMLGGTVSLTLPKGGTGYLVARFGGLEDYKSVPPLPTRP